MLKMEVSFLNIADFVIKLIVKDQNLQMELSENYIPFLYRDDLAPDISILLNKGIPQELISAKEVFKASHAGSDNDQAYFWSIRNFNSDIVILSSDPGSEIFPCLALQINSKSKVWNMFVSDECLEKHKTIAPFCWHSSAIVLFPIPDTPVKT